MFSQFPLELFQRQQRPEPYFQHETCYQNETVVSIRADKVVSDADYMEYLRRFHVKYNDLIVREELPARFLHGDRCTLIWMRGVVDVSL